MTNHEEDIEQLNSFLRGELSAVETYDQAIGKLSDDQAVRTVLEQCKTSHRRRVDQLQSEIQRLGGEPARDSGPWGSFAKLVEGGAKLFGKGAAISALEEGEDHGLNDYERDRADLTPAVRQFVDTKLVPEQKQTRAQLKKLHTMV